MLYKKVWKVIGQWYSDPHFAPNPWFDIGEYATEEEAKMAAEKAYEPWLTVKVVEDYRPVT